jgi:hypothetical protein
MTDWTTLLEWVGMRWRRPALVPPPATPIVPVERTTVHVPPEYRALCTYLEHRYASVVVLTLEQIEALLGSPLPAPARTERDWWMGGVSIYNRTQQRGRERGEPRYQICPPERSRSSGCSNLC